MKKHKHADLIKKWADGEKIQAYDGVKWVDVQSPVWMPESKYRVKPIEKWAPINPISKNTLDDIMTVEYLMRWLNDFFDNYRLKIETDNSTISATFYVDRKTMDFFEEMRANGEIDF